MAKPQTPAKVAAKVTTPTLKSVPENGDESAAGQFSRLMKKNPKLLDHLPDVTDTDDDPLPSGKFVVRLPKSLHAALIAEAEAEGVSLNTLIVTKCSVRLRSVVHKEQG